MNRPPFDARLAAVAVLAAVALVGVGPYDAADDPAAAPTPVLVSTVSTGGHCVDAVHAAGTTRVEQADGALVVAVAGNVSVPDANWALRDRGLERPSPGEYVVSFARIEETRKPGRDCTAQAGYGATVRLPDEPFTLTITVDGERVRTVRRGENASRVDAPASATQ